MAGTVVVTTKRHGPVKYALVTWTASAGGAADGTFDMDGEILRITTAPGAVAPTTLYDIALLEDAGTVDLAQTLLANRSATVAETVVPLINTQRVSYAGTVTVAVTAAGSGGTGTIKVFYR